MAELGAELVGTSRLIAVEQAVFRRRLSPDEPITIAAHVDGTRIRAAVTTGHGRAAVATLRYDGPS